MIPLSVMKKCLIPSFEIDKKGSSSELPFLYNLKSLRNVSLKEMSQVLQVKYRDQTVLRP